METITTADLTAWLDDFAHAVDGGRAQLGELDAATGDTDHGANLHRGTVSLVQMMKLQRSDAGGASQEGGADYRRQRRRLERCPLHYHLPENGLDPRPGLTRETMAKGPLGGGAGHHRSWLRPTGDKTMLDAMDPAASAFAEAIEARRGIAAAWGATARAAGSGT